MMTSTGTRRRQFTRLGAFSLLVASALVGLAAAPVGAVTLGAASAASVRSTGPAGGTLLALGDSFTGGQGAPPYTAADPQCLRSQDSSYPAISVATSPYREVLNRSCSGADTTAVLAQLTTLTADEKNAITAVTLTVGGIDAGSNDVLLACAGGTDSAQCAAAIAASVAKLAVLGPKLVSTYLAVAAALPNARIVVVNYPRLFDPSVATPGSFGYAVNSATDALNELIRQAVEAAAATNPRIVLVDVTDEFDGHGIGSARPYIAFDPANLFDPVNFHPTALGNKLGYSLALRFGGILVRP